MEFSNSSKLIRFKIFLKILNFRKIGAKLLNKLFPSKFKIIREDWKFPPLNNDDILSRVDRLKEILKINTNLECRVLSDQTILIKKA